MISFEQKTDQFTRKKIRGSELGKLENLFKFVFFLTFPKILENDQFWTENGSIYKNENSRFWIGKMGEFGQILWFFQNFQNQRKLLVLNRKRINLQERKFEDLNWGNGRICFNSPIFLFFQKSRKMTSFEQKKD